MFNEEEMSGTNCIAWFKIKTKGLKSDAIKQLIKEMQADRTTMVSVCSMAKAFLKTMKKQLDTSR